MKKHVLFLFATLLPLVASAQTKVEIDGIWYNLVSKAKQAEVTYKGDSYNSYNEYSGSITIPATVTHNGVEYSVTSIEDNAFRFCYSLTDISIPEGVTSIGGNAFQECSRLTAITIPENSQLTSIGSYTFYDCRSLNEITLPEGVTSFGECAFYYCSSLTDINIPESVTSIGQNAFRECYSLTDITITESVTSIGNGAFYDCRSLTDITITEGVTSIGNSTFRNCSNLTAITIPESVTRIGDYAFRGCSSLTTITLPKGVWSIYNEAFAGCSELTDVYCYAESVPYANADAFNGSYIEYATLHVPASAMNDYKTTAPWSSFGTIKTIENVTLEKCATPVISYVDGKVELTCKTEGAKVITTTTDCNANKFEEFKFDFIPTYTLTAYATKEQYEDSDVATLTLCWIPCTEEHKSEETGILTIPSKPVLISPQGGTITLSGLAADTEVTAYSTAGTLLATATATDGTATLATNLTMGNTAIVKMGEHSIKVVIK